MIVLTAATLSLVAAIIEHRVDPAFDNFGDALWWAVTTVSTVGYGDIVPESNAGRIAASVLMLVGLGLIPTLTSVVVSILIAERSRQEREAQLRGFEHVLTLLERLETRLDRLEDGDQRS